MNLIMGLFGLAYEWPLSFIAGTAFHRSIEARLVIYPLSALIALLIYQGTNSGLYYIVGMIAYFWAYSEGEVCYAYPESKFTKKTNSQPDRVPRALDSAKARCRCAWTSLAAPRPLASARFISSQSQKTHGRIFASLQGRWFLPPFSSLTLPQPNTPHQDSHFCFIPTFRTAEALSIGFPGAISAT